MCLLLNVLYIACLTMNRSTIWISLRSLSERIRRLSGRLVGVGDGGNEFLFWLAGIHSTLGTCHGVPERPVEF